MARQLAICALVVAVSWPTGAASAQIDCRISVVTSGAAVSLEALASSDQPWKGHYLFATTRLGTLGRSESIQMGTAAIVDDREILLAHTVIGAERDLAYDARLELTVASGERVCSARIASGPKDL